VQGEKRLKYRFARSQQEGQVPIFDGSDIPTFQVAYLKANNASTLLRYESMDCEVTAPFLTGNEPLVFVSYSSKELLTKT
jgi:hypothetical protein